MLPRGDHLLRRTWVRRRGSQFHRRFASVALSQNSLAIGSCVDWHQLMNKNAQKKRSYILRRSETQVDGRRSKLRQLKHVIHIRRSMFAFLHHLQVPVRSSGRFKLVQKGPKIICAAPRRRCTQGGLPMKLLVIYPPCRVTIRSGEQVDGSWCKFKGKMAEGGEDRRGTFWA